MSLPRHIAIIMDGNTRWAAKQSLKPIAGHKQGMEALRAIVEHCASIGIEYLTAYTFSSENWKHSEEEVMNLMDLFADSLSKESGQLAQNNIAIRFIGERNRLDADLQELMANVEQNPPEDIRMTLTIAFDYGGRADITNATRAIASRVLAQSCELDAIDEQMVASHLSQHGIPDPELCIRTSNEHRISNFLLWQLAYAELYFVPTLWPDFTPADMDKALADFAGRSRRFGGSSVS